MEALKRRSKACAVEILNLAPQFERSVRGRVILDQVIRSGTSLAANYRSACRARSRREFIARMGVAIEEGDETFFWLELAAETRILPDRHESLLREINELVAIFSAARSTALRRLQSPT
jgi:four helix bundle protein